MKLYYFISNRLRTVRKILNWLNWAWVDSHAHKHLIYPLEYVVKFILVAIYALVPIAFVVIMFTSILAMPWLTIILMAIGMLSLPLLANLLEMPLKEESD